MPTALDLSIIIVNWNSTGFVDACVRSIREETSGLAYEIIVIDNASYDGCDKMLRALHPDVVYIQSETNSGFARANNLAFESARGKAILFLNPDTKITGSAIPRLRQALHELPAAGMVGGKLLNGDGTIQTSGIQSFPAILNQVLDFDYLRRRWPRLGLWGMAPLFQSGNRPAQVEMISGACMMVKRDVFLKVGKFSEDYFMYAEDADLCYKAHQAGYKNYYVPDAVVVHFGGGSSRQAPSSFSAMMLRESIWRFVRKTRGNFYGMGYRAAMGTAACGRLALITLSIPFRFRSNRQPSWTGPFRKWRAVLLWSLHRPVSVKSGSANSTSTLNRCQVVEAVK
jgi:GT2 family glycosyltransferase